MLTIDLKAAPRFALGGQGVWAGRRWRALHGTETVVRAMEYQQLNPLQIIACSQGITLHSRGLDTIPDMWEDAAYRQRKFFNWGTGWPSGQWTSCLTGAWS